MESFDCIGCDVHKDYSVFRMFDAHRKVGPPIRIRHENGQHQRQRVEGANVQSVPGVSGPDAEYSGPGRRRVGGDIRRPRDLPDPAPTGGGQEDGNQRALGSQTAAADDVRHASISPALRKSTLWSALALVLYVDAGQTDAYLFRRLTRG
jgi:hypothetical protein